ncbi:MAG: 4Fe-4S dicluster domain-containing protein [Pseudomonadota bacterium]
MKSPREDILDLRRSEAGFAAEVGRRAGTDPNRCYGCKSCGCGCPFTEAMDMLPNQVIRLVQLGISWEALACSAIWACVGCHTCSTECPMAIDIAAIMDALRHMALTRGVIVAEPDILGFHEDVLGSVRLHGRTHKLEVMMRYKFRKRDWFSDMNLGLRMMAKRKLDILPSTVRDMGTVRAMFERNAGPGGIPGNGRETGS